jgi:hypothetical protein
MAEHKLDEWPESHFNELCKFNAAIRDAGIQGVFGTFMYNFQWCYRLPFVLSQLYFSGWLHGKADAKARREILGHDRELVDDQAEWPVIELTPQRREIEERIAARRAAIDEDKSSVFVIPFASGEAFQQVVPLLRHTVQAEVATLFPMQVVFAWAAFETLAGDLWVQAVNSHPDVLSELSGTENRIYTKARGHKPEPSGERGDKKRNTVSLRTIKEVSGGAYDLSNNMGTLLASDKTVMFISLRDIRAAYSLAFPDNVGGIKSDEIDDALADKQLDALSLVRNLLVHKSGRADQQYIRDRKGIPEAPELEQDFPLRLDGITAKSFVRFAYNVAVNLTRGVDSWMAATRAKAK